MGVQKKHAIPVGFSPRLPQTGRMLLLRVRFTVALGLAVTGFASTFATTARAVTPGLSGTLSVVPGLGQVVNGKPLEGLGWLLTVGGLYGSGNSRLAQIGFDLWMYNMYDAYRDARPPAAANHNVFQNYFAFLNPLNLVDPIGAPIVAFGAASNGASGYPALRDPGAIAMYGFVGLGEEGLYRGFLFPSLSQMTSSKWAGAILSSAIFSVAHATGGSSNLQASPLAQRFIGGLFFCWQVDRNRYDLRKSIFAHAWYDILVDDGGMIRGLKLEIPLP